MNALGQFEVAKFISLYIKNDKFKINHLNAQDEVLKKVSIIVSNTSY